MEFALLVVGLALLVAGAESLVRGASRIAAALGISPLIVGLTVVAFGTSAPEIAVSVGSVLRGDSDIAVGNVVGSNIFNVLFILGVAVAIGGLVVHQRLVRVDDPIVIGVSVAVLALSLDGHIGRVEAGLLVAAMGGYTLLQVRAARRPSSEPGPGGAAPQAAAAGGGRRGVSALDVAWVAGGLAVLVAGSRLFVDGAVGIATALGISELVIGLTIVAAGTSLPEVATSLLAAFHGERDIAVGNVVGSNVFNLLAVLGIAGLVAGDGLSVSPGVLRLDLPLMTAVAIACLPIFVSGYRIDRWEGGIFLVYYAAYVAYLVLDATDHAGLPLFGAVVLGFVVPITAITAGVIRWRGARAGRGRGDAAEGSRRPER